MDTAANKRKKRRGKLALALAFAMGFAMPVTANPLEGENTRRGIVADYTIYIGGLIVAEGSMKATLAEETYLLQSKFGSAGLPKKFWDAKWTMTSEGHVDGNELRPSRFAFSSVENEERKKRLLVYSKSGMPDLTFDPPLPPGEPATTEPFERKRTIDPVSSLLLPVTGEGNPCNRKLPVFDGKRRYDLDLIFDRKDKVVTRNKGYDGEAVVCTVRMTPHAGMEKAKVAKIRRGRDKTWIWLAPVNDGRFYIPVRVQMRTPIGIAILDVVRMRPLAMTTADAKPALK
ncbi:DUF3108 domain-containing protein [Parvibaculum sp.]|uniref:DUF3108 domain-containing protein n=1 Tax=Parvibaculum sp. TaxID=2024848 RepID=UPI003BABBFA8